MIRNLPNWEFFFRHLCELSAQLQERMQGQETAANHCFGGSSPPFSLLLQLSRGFFQAIPVNRDSR
jgi:hypothetical protein